MTTLESISEKLGFDPIYHEYTTGDHEDDNFENPLSILSVEELNYIIATAVELKKEGKLPLYNG